ncbi:MAG: ferritin-like domain-containing protein, partial [Propionibacteriaceae bacterium]|nr:ferritin-like domain-containing protein [Propionibacteriaceae bacterium]
LAASGAMAWFRDLGGRPLSRSLSGNPPGLRSNLVEYRLFGVALAGRDRLPVRAGNRPWTGFEPPRQWVREPNDHGKEPIMAEKNLENLFHDTLRDMYYAERHILKTLPKLQKAAVSDELKAAFEHHHTETEGQVKRLEKVFSMIDRTPRSKRCPAIDGILTEGDEHLEEYQGSPAADASLIASAQAVEHCEITRYGTLRRWAAMLGLSDGADLLSETLEEESRTDELLTKIAEAEANAKAAQRGK